MIKQNLRRHLALVGMTVALALASTVTALAKARIETPDVLYWQTSCESDGVKKNGVYAMWDEPTGAGKYTLTLWREGDDESYYRRADIKQNSINLQSQLTKTGDYYYMIVAYPSNENLRIYSQSLHSFDSIPLHAEIASDTGTVGSWRYDEGNNIWYYDYVNGELATGWNLINDKIYYFGEEESNEGVMFTGTHTIYDLNFQFAESGELMQRIK